MKENDVIIKSKITNLLGLGIINATYLFIAFYIDYDDDKLMFNTPILYGFIFIIMVIHFLLTIPFCIRIVVFKDYIQFNYFNFIFYKKIRRYNYSIIDSIYFQNGRPPLVKLCLVENGIYKKRTHCVLYVNSRDFELIIEKLKSLGVKVDSRGFPSSPPRGMWRN